MNIKIHPDELDQIRNLDDFDLNMLLSEIENLGWEKGGKALLPLILKAAIHEANKWAKQ